jgi:uncharacterized membrane protein
VNLVAKGMSPQDRLGVVTFGREVSIERPPDVGPLGPWVQQVAADGSDLGQALARALSLLPDDGPSRLLVISDGRWTGQQPDAAAAAAASHDTPIDFRYLGRPVAHDLAVQRLDAPRWASAGEAFMLSAWVYSPIAQQINYQLHRNGGLLSQGEKAVPAGVCRLVFRDIAQDAGTQGYELRVTAKEPDPTPENNVARTLMGIRGAGGLLLVSQSPGQGLSRLLTAGGLKVTARQPGSVDWSLDSLSGYQGVILENIPADTMSAAQMQTLASWVKQTGSGLFMTGGKQSFGPGGYFKSPIDPILPVSMELRQEHRKFSVAIVVALDRSGSMAVPVGGGKTKMDLADLGTAQVVDLLSPMDELGVIAVDSSPHTIVELGPVKDRGAIRSQVLRMQSMGGGIFIYEGLAGAAGMISKARPDTKHIILFADAADSEQPGDYKKLLAQCEAAGVTVSVIGLGAEHDSDADLLKDIAARGKGRIYFTQDAGSLPRLFAQDTFVVARSSFVDDPTPVALTGGMVSIAGHGFGEPLPVGGYNLCYIRSEANLAGVTKDQYHAPLVAGWQVGSGRVTAYTGEVDGKYTGEMANWNQLGEMLTSLTRWTIGRNLPLPQNMLIRQRVNHGQYRIELDLDPQRQVMDLERLPVVSVLSGKPGQTPTATTLTMHWISPDTLAADVPLGSDQTALATLDMGGLGVHNLAPVCLPYSPEYEPARADQGQVMLQRIARATAGKERVDLPGIWQELKRQPRWEPVAHWVLLLCVLLLLLEVFERRSGMMSLALSSGATIFRRGQRREAAADGPSPERGKPTAVAWLERNRGKSALAGGGAARDGKSASLPEDRPREAPASPNEEQPTKPGGLSEAMKEARRRAGRRSSQ